MYSLDSLHPDRLRCDRCGHALPVGLDVWDDPDSLRLLTENEAVAVTVHEPGVTNVQSSTER
jgi:hypothetical protein